MMVTVMKGWLSDRMTKLCLREIYLSCSVTARNFDSDNFLILVNFNVKN